MVRQQHQLNVHESEQTPGDNEGQKSLTCCSPWGHTELDTTQGLNTTTKIKDNTVSQETTNDKTCQPQA